MHRLLTQQLAKATDEDGSVDPARLCELVSAAYDDYDRDRRRTDRSIALMIEEIDAINRNLEKTVVERTQELRAREADLKAQNRLLDAAISNMSQGLLMFDADERLVIFNERYREMYGLHDVEIKPGATLRELVELRVQTGSFVGDPDAYVASLLTKIRSRQPSTHFVELSDGRTISVISRPMADGGWVATHEDITERRRSEMRIAHMARHDALTDLPNRLLLRERLADALAHVERGQQLAVLCLDLDQFKNVNDALGHPTGDALLKAVADRLRSCVRETDTISRVGGDEFSIIQTGIQNATDAERLARRICNAISAPYDIEGHLVMINTSIGIALAPGDGTDATDLLKNADMGLYGAKAAGSGSYRFFEPKMDARMKARRSMELALRTALENGEFELYYQPTVNLDNDGVFGCEGLLRWHHPERGLVSPLEFIPIAEEIGMIARLGEWVIRRACADAASWPGEVGVAINLSPTQLSSENLLPTVVSAMAEARLPAHRVEMEITEAVLLNNTEVTLQALHQLRALGIRISLDDFGTGYSSLSYLRSFPFDKIKIDRCFISGLSDTSESTAIVRAVTSLARSLNMTTTAEGVETRAQSEWVRALGCNEAQGYFYSPAIPSSEVTSFLSRQLLLQGAAA